ncbi:MAG: tRNA pseudouridine(55) synthase TruB [Candidatus Magasanikbacteria bacterium]|nr:tRNA pseudouridine(55) synthase TruB [Candidatus Magasanikbacteria bacterium]
MKNGYLLIDKPKDWTSHDVVAYIRKIYKRYLRHNDSPKPKRPKVGHAGTLDPFATGLLIVALGRDATKKIDQFKDMKKTYLANIKLGAYSDTQDSTGQIIFNNISKEHRPGPKHVEEVIKNFIGPQEQIPPMYSAKKIKGQKLYELARQGKTIDRKPVKINIYNLKIINYKWPNLVVEVDCSRGTYIRTLAHDIGKKLEVSGYCEKLRRTKIGNFKVENAIKPKLVKIDNIERLIHNL